MKKVFIAIFSIIILLTSCEVSESLNVDQKSPTTVPASGLFTNGARNMFDMLNECSVNVNVTRLYAQYWAQTTYPDESQYNQVTRNMAGSMWNTLYRDVLQDLKGAKETLIEEGGDNAGKLGQIKFLEVYSYSILVDTFGDVPYSEALDPLNPSPKYDDDTAIYLDLFTKLDEAIALMIGGTAFESSADPIYSGDITLWTKAANSLKLRMAMRVADDNPTLAAQKAIEASSNVISDNADNFGINYLDADPNTNPLWVNLVQSGRNDYVGANTLIDQMNTLNDPRRQFYFETVGGIYSGGIYGSANAASGFSALGDLLKEPTLKGNIITASEVEFLLAEAAARTIAVGGTITSHYNAAISNSVLEWGGTQAEADLYLALPAVAYATAAGDWKQKIGTQKWIAMFNNGFEGWTTWRIFDQPTLNAVEGMTLADIPTRFSYPISEATLNGESFSAAVSAMGGDTVTGKIFWDKN